MNYPPKGLATAFAAGLFFGASDVLVRVASTGLSPRRNLLVSLLAGTPILWTLALAGGGEPPRGEALTVYALVGVLNFVVGRLLFYLAIAYAGAATASVLSAPTILVASLLAWPLLREPLTPELFAGLLLVMAGVYLASRHPSGEPLHGGSRLLGVIAGLSSTLVFAITAVLVRHAGAMLGGDPLYGAAISYTSALPLVLLMNLKGPRDRWSRRHLQAMILAAAIVAMAQAARYTALAHLPVAVASLLIALFPLHTLAFARLLARDARERVGLAHLAGAGLSVLGVGVGLLG